MARTRAAMGPEHPDPLGSMDNLAVTLGKEKKFAEAEKLLRTELAIEIRTLGPAFPDTLATMENLAGILANKKQAEEAIALYDRAVKLASQAEQPIQMQAHYTFGSGLSILGRPGQAFEQLQRAAQLGFKDADQLANDEDFKRLRSDPRFAELLASIRKQAATLVGEISFLPAQWRGDSETVAGRIPVTIANAQSLSVGPIAEANVEILIRDLDGLKKVDPAIRGVLVQNELRHADYLLDYERRRLQFNLDGELLSSITGERLQLGKLATLITRITSVNSMRGDRRQSFCMHNASTRHRVGCPRAVFRAARESSGFFRRHGP